MKKNKYKFIIPILIILLIRIVYPYTRFYYTRDIPGVHKYSLNAREIKLKPGKSFQLRVNAVNIKCSYKSSNFRVAYVGISGKIYAIQKGRAVITVNMNNGYSRSCVVIVK